jgi:glutaredoxin
MITVYSKQRCPQCEQAKVFLTNRGIAFEVVDVGQDLVSRTWLMGQGHRSVPQIYKDGNILVEGGYTALTQMNEQQLSELLGDCVVN